MFPLYQFPAGGLHEMFRLHFDKRIAELEKGNRWKTVIDIVWQQWTDHPNDINYLLCAGTQLWYTLLVMDYLRNDPSPPDFIETVPDTQLQNCLMNVTRYGFIYFSNNPIFNAYFGYMICVMPYYFSDYNGDYSGWQSKGREMMRLSYRLDPHSPFTRAMYYEQDAYGEDTMFHKACKEIWSQITPKQWGDSEVQQYFFRILQGDMFYADAYTHDTI